LKHPPRWATFLFLLLPLTASAQQAVQTDPGINIITTRCLDCHHSGDASGGLDLSQREAALDGGDSGAAIDPETPLESLLWTRVDEDEMPPDHPLTKEEKLALKKWLKAGAAWPAQPIDRFARSTERRAGRDWWSWQPLKADQPPSDAADTWSRNDLDRYIWQRLRAENLQPSSAADPRTLVRRLYYDLIGLPPPNAVVEAFAAEPSGKNWTQLVDNLLDSPRYGEQWGNHWLDVARFGESQGYEYNEPRNGAWLYRDWVIEALNRDLPYNEFARQQIAGDSLVGQNTAGLAPLGFLVSGPHNTVLGVTETMKATARQEELEEIAGTLGQAFLGLTVNCARCHDHKFDPITAEEYYGFIANLAGTTHGNRQAQSELAQHQREQTLARQAELQQQLEQSYRQRNANFSKSANRLSTSLPPSANRKSDSYQLEFSISPTVWADASQATSADDRIQVELYRADRTQLAAESFAPGDWIAADRKQSFQSKTVEYIGDGVGQLVLELGSLEHNGKFAGGIDSIRCRDQSGQLVWQEEFHPIQRDPAPGIQANTSLAVHCRLQFTGWKVEGLNAAHAVEFQPGEFALQIYGGVIDSPGVPESEQELAWVSELQAIQSALTGENLFTVVSTAPSGMRVYNRGDVRQPGKEVLPSALSLAANTTPAFGLDNVAPDPLRRQKLAEWLTAPDNALFLRVAVNRVWHHHFGTGLLPKTSDFGFNGGQPSHPELLEWLAHWFQQNGQSQKQLHRLILNSATWRQSSRAVDNPTQTTANRVDTSNRLLWRQNPRRLAAEELRDGMLLQTGLLDLKMGGPGYTDFAIEQIGAAHYYRHNGELDPSCWRRSIYRFRIRGDRSPLLDSFDCPDPSATAPVRNVTTTPTQALALWNNELVLEVSQRLADKLRAEQANQATPEFVSAAWMLLFQRQPTETERAAASELVDTHGLEALIRVLFNSNEYLLVD
jgi:mono/diheme cytochrome c family protein